jgi:hypothetical protein
VYVRLLVREQAKIHISHESVLIDIYTMWFNSFPHYMASVYVSNLKFAAGDSRRGGVTIVSDDP